MSANSKIEWTEHTWSPWEGCSKVSPGCADCFAAARNHRFGMDNWGEGKPRRERSENYWQQPPKWNRHADGLSVRPRVFPSLCDPFDLKAPFAWFNRFWKLVHDTPNLTWLVLTKRPENVPLQLDRIRHFWGCDRSKVIPQNVCLGVSVENQEWADKRREALAQIPVAVRFVSYEPAIGPVNWSGWEFVQQIISGGESGLKARPSHPEWHRATRDFCVAHGIKYFFKQWGEFCPLAEFELSHGGTLKLGRHHVFEDGTISLRIGKKQAGRLLDGREWNEYPV